MQLTGRGAGLMSMGLPVDHAAASAANSLPAVRFERNGFLSLALESFVHDIEHLQERHVFEYVGCVVRLEMTAVAGAILAPHVEFEVHL